MGKAANFTPITQWGGWIYRLAKSSDEEIANCDIAEINLRCAESLPGTDDRLLDACVKKANDWAKLVDEFTRHVFPLFVSNPQRFQGSETRFRVVALAECLQRHVGIRYNVAFAEGEYDASDSRNLFIHGVLAGFGGTCASMPVLYCAIGRRLGYPLKLCEASQHFFCRWDGGADGESFCFDATGRGCAIRDEGYYRRWPKPITPVQERTHGLIRSLTRREELAAFATLRGNCLFDNFQFVPAVEAYYLGKELAPQRECHHQAWGLAVYSSKLWSLARNTEDLQDMPIEAGLRAAVQLLRGPNIDFFRDHAVENLLRIIRNRRCRDAASSHEAALQQLLTE
jgi:hypothetical protein